MCINTDTEPRNAKPGNYSSDNTNDPGIPLPHGSDTADLDSVMFHLSKLQPVWRNMEPSKKLAILKECLQNLKDIGAEGVIALGRLSAERKGVVASKKPSSAINHDFLAIEECFTDGCLMLTLLKNLIRAYEQRSGSNVSMKKEFDRLPKKRIDDQGVVSARVFPLNWTESQGPLSGVTAEAIFDPSYVQTIDDIQPFAFEDLQDQAVDGETYNPNGVHVVLGAGNHNFLTFTDTLDGLFVKNRVVFIKHHPIRGDEFDPFLRMLLRPLFERGFLQSECDVSIDRSQSILHHDLVHSVHMTGSKATHDAIVWGRNEYKDDNDIKIPALRASMTSELGCVTPWIMAPAKYTTKEISCAIANLHLSVWTCASSNCNAAKVLIVSESWDQRQMFLDEFYSAWSSQVDPFAYYPGSRERWQMFRDAYPQAREIRGRDSSDSNSSCRLPLLVIDIQLDLSTEEGRERASQELVFRVEPFCPVLAIVTLVRHDVPTSTPPQTFISDAVDLCNNFLFGTLSASMSVPKSVEGSDCIERAIFNLEYGSIVLNLWSAYGYNTGPWGGYAPRESIDNVQSGIGAVNNRLFLKHVMKSVIRAPSESDSTSLTLLPLERQTETYDSILRLHLDPSNVMNLVRFLMIWYDIPAPELFSPLGLGLLLFLILILIIIIIMAIVFAAV